MQNRLFGFLQWGTISREELEIEIDSLYELKKFLDMISMLENASTRHESEFTRVRNDSTRIDETLQKISARNEEIFARNAEIAKVNAELLRQSKFQADKISALEKKFSAPENNFEQLEKIFESRLEKFMSESRSEWENQQKKINQQYEAFEKKVNDYFEQLSAGISERDKIIAGLNQRIASLESRPAQVVQQVSGDAQKIATLETKIKALEEENFALKKAVATLQISQTSQILPVAEPPQTPKTSPTLSTPEPAAVAPKIFKFNLPATKKVYLRGSEEEILQKFRAAQDVDELKKFLEQAKNPQSATFIRNLDKHVNYLQRALKKLDLDGEENFSQQATEQFFDAFKPALLNNLVTAIYRGYDKDRDFYEQFLELVNKYLGKFGIYTRKVEPSKYAQEADYDDMTPIAKHVGEENLHQMIFEVSRLPYYINYFDAAGEVKTLCNDGEMTVASFKN